MYDYIKCMCIYILMVRKNIKSKKFSDSTLHLLSMNDWYKAHKK